MKKIIEGLELKNLKKIEDFEIEKQILKRITKFASIRHILNKNENNQENEEKIIYFLNEIKRDLKNTELELRIEELESKFSKDFSENTFNELKELKKQQKIN